jgi:SH3 domain-containing YSC84-like protein 1
MSLTVNRRTALLGAASLSAVLALAHTAHASDQQDLIDQARITLEHLRTDKAFGTARSLLTTARGVLIIPHIVKAGFFFGGEGGNGVLLERRGQGWSQPAFYTMGSASFGLQAGVQVSEMVVILRSARALQAVLNDHYKVGATADITLATLGSSAEAASSGALADIIVWASSSGVFAGLSVNGSLIDSRPAWNRAYYGRNVTVREVLADKVSSRGTAALRTTLASIA